MEEVLHILWHSFKHTIIILPFIFLVYVLIEVIEMYSVSTVKSKHMLRGKYSPLIASSLGLVPQCGFSVVATDLYAKKYISIGTLLAVFIATSDEAIPIMLSNPKSAIMLLPLLAVKFVAAILVGYSAHIIEGVWNKKHGVEYANHYDHDHHDDNDDHSDIESVGCCGHNLGEQKTKLQRFLLHPLIHSLKIIAFVFAVNLALEIILHFVGEDNLAIALGVNTIYQPLVAALIGLIPNCASSVAITQLYVSGVLSFGACVAGLTANAGVAYMVLLKDKSNIKKNISIIGIMYVISVLIGFATLWIK
jgi:hypothetical protein